MLLVVTVIREHRQVIFIMLCGFLAVKRVEGLSWVRKVIFSVIEIFLKVLLSEIKL